LQGYFSRLRQSPLADESVDKIRDALSAILRTAIDYGSLQSNPAEKIRLKRRQNRRKPFLRRERFYALLEAIAESCATMIYVAAFTALRVSELATHRWRNIGTHSITVEERYSRGDFDQPKSEASRATISVDEHVIARIEKLKSMEAMVRA
jgi:integrase